MALLHLDLICSLVPMSGSWDGPGIVESRSLPDLCSITDGRSIALPLDLDCGERLTGEAAIVDNRLSILSANYTFDDGRGSNQGE